MDDFKVKIMHERIDCHLFTLSLKPCFLEIGILHRNVPHGQICRFFFFFFFHFRIVVDLKRGVYYQKCHDPDCKSIDYRSPGMYQQN